MPFNGSGIYIPVAAPDFPAVPGTTIRSGQYNNQINDMALKANADALDSAFRQTYDQWELLICIIPKLSIKRQLISFSLDSCLINASSFIDSPSNNNSSSKSKL